MSDWGKGSENNNIGWGQAAGSATNNWGESQKTSWAGQTDIVGLTTLNISYSADNYCEDGGNTPQPTVSNNVGAGTFSSTAGLVIDANTGVINTDTSTVGSYVVTYTDTNAATATDSVDILALPTVIVSTSDGTICVGESTILTASGASTYVWNDGVTLNPRTVSPTTTTTYTATGNDGFCTSAGSTTITVNALPSVSISGTLTYCAGIGASTTLDAGAGFASYLWSTGATTQTISATAGNYTVTVTDSNGCSNTSAQVTVTETPLDVATVTYSAASYCQMPTGALAVDGYYPLYATESAAQAESSDGTAHSHTLSGTTYYMPNDGITIYHGTYSLTTPAPTITGETGTFSESTGNLSIDSSTGVINVNNSTAGTYTVVYTTNGSCPTTVNNTITVNALDGATFAYSSNSLPQTGTASLTTTPTTSGGVYSAYPSGLSINSSTGEIDLANSTIQSYKIFYETSGAGCPNSSTFDLAVTAAGIANNYSMNFDGVNDYIDVGNPTELQITGALTGVNILTSGTNYSNIFLPDIVVSGDGENATVTGLVADNGTLTGIKVVEGGSGYSQPPNIIIYSGVSSISIDNSGQGYFSSPVVEISGGREGGTSASATLNVSNGAVSSVSITNFGNRYTGVPTLNIIPGLSGVILTHSGSGYLSEPTVFINNGGGSGASVNALTGDPATAFSGFITGFELVSGGSGYTGVPTVLVSGGSPTISGSGNAVLSSGFSGTVNMSSGASATGVTGNYTKDFTGVFNLLTGSGFSYHNFREAGQISSDNLSYTGESIFFRENSTLSIGVESDINIQVDTYNYYDSFSMISLLTVSGSGSQIAQLQVTGIK